MQTVASKLDKDLKRHQPFVKLLRGRSSEELFEMERAVDRLVESDGWEVLTSLLKEARDDAQATLVYGKTLPDGATYAKALGYLGGIEAAEAAAEAVLIHARDLQERLEAEVGRDG
jgi:hypothetical protein